MERDPNARLPLRYPVILPVRPINQFLLRLAACLDFEGRLCSFALAGGLPAVTICMDYRNVRTLTLATASATALEELREAMPEMTANDLFPAWPDRLQRLRKLVKAEKDVIDGFSVSFTTPFAHHHLKLNFLHVPFLARSRPAVLTTGSMTLPCLEVKAQAVLLMAQAGRMSQRLSVRNPTLLDFLVLVRRWRLKGAPLMEALGNAGGYPAAAAVLRALMQAGQTPGFWSDCLEHCAGDESLLAQFPIWADGTAACLAEGIRPEWVRQAAEDPLETGYVDSQAENSDLGILMRARASLGQKPIPDGLPDRPKLMAVLVAKKIWGSSLPSGKPGEKITDPFSGQTLTSDIVRRAWAICRKQIEGEMAAEIAKMEVSGSKKPS